MKIEHVKSTQSVGKSPRVKPCVPASSTTQEHRVNNSMAGIDTAYFPDAIAIFCDVARKVPKHEWQKQPDGVQGDG